MGDLNYAVLVYDISRGRHFQDLDEPAHYEFPCKSARIVDPVIQSFIRLVIRLLPTGLVYPFEPPCHFGQ
jgi:hypothetical protein